MTDSKLTRQKAGSKGARKMPGKAKKPVVQEPAAIIESGPAIIDAGDLHAYHEACRERASALSRQLSAARAHGEALELLVSMQARALDDIEAKRLASETRRTALHSTMRQIETSLVWRYARIVRAAGRRLGPLARLAGLIFGGALEIISGRILSREERRKRRRALLLEDRAVILASDLFDADWYRACYPDIIEFDGSPLDHYLRFGVAESRNPNPAFDTAWYLATYPEVAASGRNPLAYYALFGIGLKHAASPRFDTHWYAVHHASHLASGMTPLQHFIHAGQWMGLPTQASDAARSHAVEAPAGLPGVPDEPRLPALKPVSASEQ